MELDILGNLVILYSSPLAYRYWLCELEVCSSLFCLILFRHRIEVLREIALRLRELSVLPPFRANATGFTSSEHFQQ